MSGIQDGYLKKCLLRIEDMLGFGPAPQWTHRNFEGLSSQIEQKTGVIISVSTLKRIWSPSNKNTPQKATLDTLAQFLEYSDWFHFMADNKLGLKKKKYLRILWVAIVGVLLILDLMFLPGIIKSKTAEKNSDPSTPYEIKEGLNPVLEKDRSLLKVLNEADTVNE